MPEADAPPRLSLARTPSLRDASGAEQPLHWLDGALLAWLALEGPTPRSRMAALLWPNSDADAARNALRQRLFNLRRRGGGTLLTDGATLALAAGVEHDLDDADGVLGDQALTIGAEFDGWLEQQRQRRRDRVRDSMLDLCEMAEAAADWPDALALAHELLALSPRSEDAYRRLMRLHYLAGDRSAALLAFDACERMLKDEVGTRPAAETLALLATIENARAAPAAAPAGRRVPASVLRPPRLVGRGPQWQALQQAWDRGHAALVSGDGGLGKSRLAADFAAAHGVSVVAGARPGDERAAYASFSRLLRALPRSSWAGLAAPLKRELARLMPELGDSPAPLRGDADRTRFFNAVAALFGPGTAAAEGVVFDDLHLADEASLDLLRYVVDARPGRWLMTARLGETAAAARRLIDGWLAPPDRVEVPLLPLTAAEVAELVDSLGIEGLQGAKLAEALVQRSGGNPLYLLEMLKAGWLQAGSTGAGALATTLPATPGVHAMIERRISRLSMPAVQLARCAAVAAPDFSIELAAHVLAQRTIDLADPWAELEAAQILLDGGAFAHDLIFEAALASVPAPVARQLHADIAAVLATRRGEPVRLARHWAAAARWPEAGVEFRAAAQRALDAGRTIEAAALLADAAAAFYKGDRDGERFDALLDRARLLAENDAGSIAQTAISELQLLAQDPLQRLAVLEVQLAIVITRGEAHLQLETGRQALAAAKAGARPDLELRFAVRVAEALCDLRRGAEAAALLQPYADWASKHAGPEQLWDFWCAMALSLDYANRLREALPAWDRARVLAEQAGRLDLTWKTLANHASTLAKMGFVQRAAQQIGRACEIAEAECASAVDSDGGTEMPLRVQQTRMTWAHRLRDIGHLGPALELLERALPVFEAAEASTDCANVEHRLAQVFQQLGQPARAAQLLARERPGLPPGLALMRLVHQADVAHQLGRPGLPQMRQALALIDNPDDVYHRIASLFATRLVPADEGEALATSLAAWGSARERLGLALAGHVRAAACALAQQAPRRAAPHAEAALHLAAERQPDSFYLPEMWLVAGQVDAALGRNEAAARQWSDGVAWVQRIAAAQVPAQFQDSFLHRNPVNAELLRLVARG